MSLITVVSDTLRNLASGLGSVRDKSAASNSSFVYIALDPAQLEAMYRSDWMADKAVEIPAFDAVRNWRTWQAEKNAIEAIEAEEVRLELQGKVLEALILARLWGGSALVMGVGSDDPSTELKPDRVQKGGLRYVHAMSRYELTASELRTDPEDPYFREPKMWQLATSSGTIAQIHPSRVVSFIGKRRARRVVENDPWGDSVLDKIADTVRSAGLASATIAQLLTEAKIDVVKVPDLMTGLSTDAYTERLTTRFSTAMAIKSTTNTLLLDANETFEQKQISFSELPEVMQQYLLAVSGAADIPSTRFLGQSPAGLSATGESDIRNYYDRIAADQRLTLSPRLSRLDEVLIRSASGSRDDAIHPVWNPLWQTSEKEASEIEKARADTYKVIDDSGLVPAKVLSKALVNSMIESGRYPGVETAMEDYEAEAGEFDPDEGGPDDPEEVPGGGLPGVPGAVVIPPGADVPEVVDPDAEPEEDDPDAEEDDLKDAAPRTLYVYRKVVNGAAILKWAKAQGFTELQKASELHVTIAHSREPVDWMKAGQAWQAKLDLPEGGPRLMDRYGDATVILFRASEIEWRHEDIKRTGAVWKHEDYQPHITISWGDKEIDLEKVKPYQGKIVLGPEIFEEVSDTWKAGKA